MICNVLEDEFHFLMICPMYTELRRIYIHSFYLKKPSMFKLVELVSSSNRKTIRNLGIFITKAFEKRTDILSQI